ncbi:MAG: hypothetical protein CSB13_01860 [Chloroflexi bacterium]|nr:MAG: hypothetical protein CSB13_01860 [Chloroflexota bacterium]
MTHKAELSNTRMLQLVAEKLGRLREKVVFLGGAVIPFLITEPDVPMTRFTKDIDIIFRYENREELYEFEDGLRDSGFKKKFNGAVCQWEVDGVHIDVFPTDPEVITRFIGNHWWAEAEQSAITADIGNGLIINIIPGHCFVGVKLCAFMMRGKRDYLMSYDINDIILIIAGRAEIEQEVLVRASPQLRKFIIGELKNIYSAVKDNPASTLQTLNDDMFPKQLASKALARIQQMIA